jgi:hypothetical protein
MRSLIGLMLGLFSIALLAPQAVSEGKTYPYPLAQIQERFTFSKEKATLAMGVTNSAGQSDVAQRTVDAWRVYLKHQTVRGFMDLKGVSVSFVDAKGRAIIPSVCDKQFDPRLHRLIVECYVDVASIHSPKYVVIDTPEQVITYDVTELVKEAK